MKHSSHAPGMKHSSHAPFISNVMCRQLIGWNATLEWQFSNVERSDWWMPCIVRNYKRVISTMFWTELLSLRILKHQTMKTKMMLILLITLAVFIDLDKAEPIDRHRFTSYYQKREAIPNFPAGDFGIYDEWVSTIQQNVFDVSHCSVRSFIYCISLPCSIIYIL